MQPTEITHLSTVDSHRRRRARVRVALIAGSILFGTALIGCGGSSEEGSSSTAPAADSAPSTPDSGGGDPATTEPAASTLDVCAEITEADVTEILTGATLSGSEPLPGPNPSCQYFTDVGGFEGAVVQIQLFPTEYYDGQKEIQSEAVDLPGLDEAFTIGDRLIIAKTATGTVQVSGGIEVTPGQPATLEQLTAVAALAQDL